MKLEIASLSHRGLVREINEDSFCYVEPSDEEELKGKGSLFLVADGMGGHQGGEIASQLAVESIRSSYYSSKEKDPSKALSNAFEAANSIILERALSDIFLFGMGTTCTAMAINKGKAYFAHIGDSRAYKLRRGELEQITQDHSIVGEMVRSGVISKEDAMDHPRRNVITRSLGTRERAFIDTPCSPTELEIGDVFLLCSDGLTGFVSDQEIKEILGSHEPKEACRLLVDMANRKGGKDNVTVQVVKVSNN